MTQKLARNFMRIVATLAGVFGVITLCIAPFTLYYSIMRGDAWMIFFAALPLMLGAYGIYLAYVVWFRFSPLAVRHICGALGFCVIIFITRLLDPVRHSSAAWPAFASLGCLIVVYF